MAQRVYLNFVSTRLTAALAAAGLTANVTTGTGVLFAGAAGGDWIIAVLSKVSGYREIAWEVVKITARATDALTIARAQEGTTAIDFAIDDVLSVRETAGSFAPDGITTVTDATYTVATNIRSVIANRAGTITLTLPAAASFTGRELWIRTITANTVVSASSNVVPLVGGSAGTAILAAADGAWALLKSDGTDWQIMA